MNYRMIKNILGWILIFEAAFMTLPLLTAAIYKEKVFFSFLISIGICLLIGFLLVCRKPKDRTLYSREGFIIVALSWITLSIFGALPFCISGEIPNYIDALFETVSGFTTTGSSIVPAVEELSHAALMWRSFTHWVGGMGVLVFIMAFIPLSGGNNMHIMRAESPGPSVSKLVPKVKTTAMILYLIYIGLTLLEFVLLLFGSMNAFEALNISFATAGTGVQSIAKAFRARARLSFTSGCPALSNDEKMCAFAEKEIKNQLGEELVISSSQFGESAKRMGGSEDFAYIAREVPSVMLALCAGETEKGFSEPLHHPKVRFDETALVNGVVALSGCAFSWRG